MFDYRDHLLQARNAVILSRVSSKEQEDGYSIDGQTHRLKLYCERRKLNVLKIFELTESSTLGNRREFMNMIKFVKRQRGTIAIVADKVDRVQRSFNEYPLLNSLIIEGKIELHFNTENYVIHKHSAGHEKTVWSMGVWVAESYVNSLRDNVKRGMEQKIRQGGWIAMAPIGYKNIRDQRDRGDLIIDPLRAPLIKRLFETYATGAHTLGEMHQKTINWGLTNWVGKQRHLVRSQVYKILNNPFYYGQMKIKGQLYPHCYTPIIPKEMFDKCQAVMKGWHKKPFQWAGKDFVFRGLVTCASTGRTVTSDTKKKTYQDGRTAQWTYLRCANPNDPTKIQWVKEENVLKQVEKVLEGFDISPSLLKQIYAYLETLQHSEEAFHTEQLAELSSELKSIESNHERLLDLLLDEVIDKGAYNSRSEKMNLRKMELESLIDAHQKGDDGFKKSLSDLLFSVTKSYELFKGSTTPKKRLALNFIFANLSLKGDKLLYSLKEPLHLFTNCTDLSQWRRLIDRLRTDPELRALVTSMQPLLEDLVEGGNE